MAPIIRNANYTVAEGFTGKKKSFASNPWPDIFASLQDKYALMHELVLRVEEPVMDEKENKKMPCAVVMIGHVKGLIPLPESGCESKEKMRKLIGQNVVFRVTHIMEESNLFIASRKSAIDLMAKETLKKIKEGEVRTAVVREVNFKSAIVDIGGIQAKLPVGEMSWGWVNDVRQLMSVGDSFDVKVMSLDRNTGEIKVSLREADLNPWP